FTENMASRSLPARWRVLSAAIGSNGHDIAARLALPSDSRLVMVERMRNAAEEPFALETCYLSAERFADVVRAPLERASLFAFLEREHGLQLAHADEEIDATAADHRIAKLLDIPKGAPLLRIRQLIYSTEGQAVLYVLGLYLSDRHTVRVRRFR